MNRDPYRFAARVAAFGCAFAAFVWAVDAANTALRVRGVRLIPKVPPPELSMLLSARGRVLVMGDSVIRFVPPRERGEPSLFEMLERETDVGLVDGSWPGRAVDMYAAMTAALVRHDVRPRAVVIEINLRHFSPAWVARPDLQAASLAPMLETGSYLPLRAAAVLKYRFGAKTDEEFLSTPLRVGGRTVATVRDLRPRPWFTDDGTQDVGRLSAVTTCAFDFEGSAWVERLDRLLATATTGGIPRVAFVTPLDVELIRKLLPDADHARVLRNLETLRGMVNRPGVDVVDLSTSLPTSAFDHVASGPDEHLTAAGRRIVAGRIGATLRAVLAR